MDASAAVGKLPERSNGTGRLSGRLPSCPSTRMSSPHFTKEPAPVSRSGLTTCGYEAGEWPMLDDTPRICIAIADFRRGGRQLHLA